MATRKKKFDPKQDGPSKSGGGGPKQPDGGWPKIRKPVKSIMDKLNRWAP